MSAYARTLPNKTRAARLRLLLIAPTKTAVLLYHIFYHFASIFYKNLKNIT